MSVASTSGGASVGLMADAASSSDAVASVAQLAGRVTSTSVPAATSATTCMGSWPTNTVTWSGYAANGSSAASIRTDRDRPAVIRYATNAMTPAAASVVTSHTTRAEPAGSQPMAGHSSAYVAGGYVSRSSAP